MKLIECESRNGGSKLIQVLSFSIENYEMLKLSNNLVFLVEDDKEIKENFEYNYFDELEYAFNSNTLFYQILFNCEAYKEKDIEYLIKFIDFDKVSSYTFSNVIEEYFTVENVMTNKYLKDKVNQNILLHICSFVYDFDEYVDDEYNINAEKAFKDYVDIVTEAGITLGEKDLKEACIEYWNEYYEGNIKDLLNYLKI